MKKWIIFLFVIVIVLGGTFILENRLLILSYQFTEDRHVESYREDFTFRRLIYEERILAFHPERVLMKLDFSGEDCGTSDVMYSCKIREYQYKNEIIQIKEEIVTNEISVIERISSGYDYNTYEYKYYYYDDGEYKNIEDLKGIYVIISNKT